MTNDGYIFIEVPGGGGGYWNVNFPDIPHIHFYTVDSLVKSFEKNGFICVSAGNFGPTIEELVNLGGVFPQIVDSYAKNEQGCLVRGLFKKR